MAKRLRRASVAVWISSALFALACSVGGPTANERPSGTKVNVVSTSSILGDWAQQVGGDAVSVVALIPPGADPHTFQPGARDVAYVADADLVLSVGLDLEGQWLTELINNVEGESARNLVLGPLVDPIEPADRKDVTEHTDVELDPHFWMDPIRVKMAVLALADELAAIDSEHGDLYRENAKAYSAKLDQLDAWVRGEFADIPEAERTFVSTHDSLAYFAESYQFQIVGAVIPGVTTERDPSASEIADLIDAIEASRAKAIFLEEAVSDRMARRISEETGVPVVEGIMVGSLGPAGSDTGTYEKMMRRNVEIIAEALR